MSRTPALARKSTTLTRTPPRATGAGRSIQHRSGLSVGLDVKAASDGWEVSGYASTFNDPEPDSYGDVVAPGAFSASLARQTPAFLFTHDAGQPIGRTLELREDRVGLWGRWSIVDTAAGTDAHKLLKAGAVDGLSIGFYPEEYAYRGDGARVLTKVELVEVSLVALPANQNATVTSVKSAAATARQLQTTRARLQLAGVDVGAPGAGLGRRVADHPEMRALREGKRQQASVHLADVDTRALFIPPPGATELHPELTSGGTPIRSVLDFLPSLPTATGLVGVPTSAGATGAAAVGDGELKPELVTGYGRSTVTTTTVAGVVYVTRQVLSDGQRFEQVVNTDATQAVRDELERQVLSGDGVDPNMLGIAGWPGIGTLTATAGQDLAALLAAIGLVVVASRQQPTVCAVSLESWAALVADPAVVEALGPTLGLPGGVPIVPTAGLAAGTALVGSGPTAPVFVQQGITVDAGNINDSFIRNIAVLRGEVLAVVAVAKPAAWCLVDGLSTGATP